MLRETIFVLAALLLVADATTVYDCDTGTPYEDKTRVQIPGCEDPPCLLKRKTQASVEQKFTPDKDIQNLVTEVSGIILGVPVPFLGVDGTSACDNIFNADGTKGGCPLKKGVEYVYKNSFPILPVYPTIPVVVRYALREGINNRITCFEVPSRITN